MARPLRIEFSGALYQVTSRGNAKEDIHHHGRVGHVFQGRYKAIWVERDSYLKESARYVVLNSVRAKKAYESGAYTLAQIAGYFGVHYSTVSRAVKQPE